MPTAKKRCVLCKEYRKNSEIKKSNIGSVCISCLQDGSGRKKNKKTNKAVVKKKKGLKRKIGAVSLVAICDKLWADCVKAKAGYVSEISNKRGKQIGGEYVLNAHQINGKPNHQLRYDIDNGVCLTSGEHKFGIHNQGKKAEYEEKIKQAKGYDCYSSMKSLKWKSGKIDLQVVKLYLEKELARIKQKAKDLQCKR